MPKAIEKIDLTKPDVWDGVPSGDSIPISIPDGPIDIYD
jgi:hypothetical protein